MEKQKTAGGEFLSGQEEAAIITKHVAGQTACDLDGQPKRATDGDPLLVLGIFAQHAPSGTRFAWRDINQVYLLLVWLGMIVTPLLTVQWLTSASASTSMRA